MTEQLEVKSGKIDFEQSVALIEESKVNECVDLGHSLLYRLLHPQHGTLVVLNSGVGACGLLTLN